MTTDDMSAAQRTSDEPGTRRFRPADRRNVLATAARAFTHDPMYDFMAGDRLRAHRLLPGLLGGTIDDLVTYGDCWVADDEDGAAVGIAGWLSPAMLPRGAAREIRIALKSVSSAARMAQRVKGARLLAQIERRHLKEPHWFLGLLVVDPAMQSRGLGSRLIVPGMEAAERDGLPCYLETQKESNVTWYGRFGFQLTDTIDLVGVPNVWCMTRPAT